MQKSKYYTVTIWILWWHRLEIRLNLFLLTEKYLAKKLVKMKCQKNWFWLALEKREKSKDAGNCGSSDVKNRILEVPIDEIGQVSQLPFPPLAQESTLKNLKFGTKILQNGQKSNFECFGRL